MGEAWLMAATFASSFVFIGLKAWQQRSVAFRNYWWIPPTSMAMAFVEVFIIANIAQQGWNIALVLMVGLGSGLGALAATYSHNRFLTKH